MDGMLCIRCGRRDHTTKDHDEDRVPQQSAVQKQLMDLEFTATDLHLDIMDAVTFHKERQADETAAEDRLGEYQKNGVFTPDESIRTVHDLRVWVGACDTAAAKAAGELANLQNRLTAVIKEIEVLKKEAGTEGTSGDEPHDEVAAGAAAA